jgi:hypothetical protein
MAREATIDILQFLRIAEELGISSEIADKLDKRTGDRALQYYGRQIGESVDDVVARLDGQFLRKVDDLGHLVMKTHAQLSPLDVLGERVHAIYRAVSVMLAVNCVALVVLASQQWAAH